MIDEVKMYQTDLGTFRATVIDKNVIHVETLMKSGENGSWYPFITTKPKVWKQFLQDHNGKSSELQDKLASKEKSPLNNESELIAKVYQEVNQLRVYSNPIGTADQFWQEYASM